MPSKTWVVGEEVLAADFNTYVQEQVVATFPTSAARSTAIPAPKPGMVTYLTDTGQLQVWSGTAWAAWSTTRAYVEKTNVQSVGTGAEVDISGLTTGPIVIPAGRRIEVAAEVPFQKNAPDVTSFVTLSITDAANVTLVYRAITCLAPGNTHINATRLITPAAGTYTWKCRSNTGGGFVNVEASSQSPGWIRVTDLGSA